MKRRKFLQLAGCASAFGVMGMAIPKINASEKHPNWDTIDKLSLPRRCLTHDKIGSGIVPCYTAGDGNADAVSMQGVIRKNKDGNVLIPVVPITKKKTHTIIAEENRAFIDMLDCALDQGNIRIHSPTSVINREALAQLFKTVEAHDLSVAHILCNEKTLKHLEKESLLLDYEKSDVRREYLWGADIAVSNSVPNGKVYALAEEGFLGIFVDYCVAGGGKKNDPYFCRSHGMLIADCNSVAELTYLG